MRILYYSPHPQITFDDQSGAGTHIREMIKAFEQAGHEVYPLIMGNRVTPPNSKGNEEVKIAGFKGIGKKILPRSIWETIKDINLIRTDQSFEDKIVQAIDEFKPDFIYERANFLQISGVKKARERNVPHVLEMNGPYLVEEPIRRNYKLLLQRAAWKRENAQLNWSTKIAVVSQGLIEYFQARHKGLPAEKFLFTPNGINPEDIKVDSTKVEQLKLKYSLQDKFVIGFTGSFAHYQRVDILVQAFAELKQEYPNIKLLLVGSGASMDTIQALVKRLAIQDDVVFTGKVPHEDIYNYVEIMNVAVLPDNMWYGSPTKIFEYGALGKTIIAPDNTTMRGIIQHGKEGWLTSPSVDSMVAALKFLINDEKRRMAMGNIFQQKILKEYNWMKNVEKIVKSI
ncbi:MAG TPA: glycosyltransferase family 4 protein [Saprospiraceae bacterium]|nr:glycosyltransferase family 4 protein [Saprospiraceae bacterium]HMP23673.1 glycosyltransferase family 4 protein [Saprospiraceae bacterium]